MEPPTHQYRCLCGRNMRIGPFQIGRIVRCPPCKRFVVVPTVENTPAKSPVFERSTGNLGIQLATRKQWREIHEIYSDERNFAFEISSPSSERETRALIKKAAYPSGFAKSNQLLFRVSTLKDGQTVGTLGVSFPLPYYSVYVGFMIKNSEQGKGYGTEALTAVCQLLHFDLGVERITAMCDAKNLACRVILEKAGFKQEGLTEKLLYHVDRGWIDSCTYASLRQPSSEPAGHLI